MTLDPAAVAAKMRGMDTPQEQVRVFFALWPTPQERAALAAWQAGLHRLCGGRVMQPDTLHTTLVFLGEVAENQMAALQCAAREVALEPFELCFDAARYWGHNHVVFAAPGVAPAPLHALVRSLEQLLAAHRFRFERRPYQPHVTLLRHAQWNDAPLPAMPAACWRINDFVLVQSLRDGHGACYRVLGRFGVSALE